ncbi:MAG: septum formation protein Maf [Neisseriaceae bacterium]|nr:septum formation protein Maf [Neisseriaceae bacterium]MBP6862836.1 septum formation protein Maf [Neisseriaceae bacterium]
MKNTTLVLGSSSVFRQAQLKTLGLSFTIAKPNCDETPLANESAHDTALRLAVGKAQSLANAHPHSLIIGADQVAFVGNQQLGKPMSADKAFAMLQHTSGKVLTFYSALCLLNTDTLALQQHVDVTEVTMRALSDATIKAYLAREPDAIYCAGAAKSEGLGAALIQRIHSEDPNALIGLPIFKLIDFLANEGIHPL